MANLKLIVKFATVEKLKTNCIMVFWADDIGNMSTLLILNLRL